MRPALHVFAACLAAAFVPGLCSHAQSGAGTPAAQPGFIRSEFVAQPPLTAISHSSTIVESDGDLLAAWVGGSRERSPDVAVFLSRQRSSGWTVPAEIANGRRDRDRIQYACWNPVLFRPRQGPLYLFYKEGPSPVGWWGMVKVSEDNGKSWSKGKKLPDDIFGPIRNKPIELPDGSILCGSSIESSGWLVHVERTKNPLLSWKRSSPLNSSMEWGAIQPTFLHWNEQTIQMLCRTRQGKVTQVWSHDRGRNWSAMSPTDLPNPNGAIDSVVTRDGLAVLACNYSTADRSSLHIAVSKDGRSWQAALTLENEPGSDFSYPAIIQSSDGLLHVTYTWKKSAIKHVVLDPAKFAPQPIRNGQWPR